MKLVLVFADNKDSAVIDEVFRACGCEILAIGTTGTEAISLCQDLKPDCLVMEPFLPYLNCDEIAALLEQKCKYPLAKLVVTPFRNDVMAARFMAAGGDLFLRSPFDGPYTVRRIEFILDKRRSAEEVPSAQQTLCYITSNLLSEMKMPSALQGFHYLQDAVCLLAEDRGRLKRLVSELYPTIALARQTTPGGVERCIRNAISHAFDRGDPEFLYTHFGHVVKNATGRPANGEFMSVLLDLVRKELNMM